MADTVSSTSTSSRDSIPLPPPLISAITSKPDVSIVLRKTDKVFAFAKDCLCSVKSILTAAAFTPAVKSAIVIDVVANTNATFGLSSRNSLSSRTASTFLNPFLLLAIRISERFMSCSVTNWSLTISTRVTLTRI